MSTYSQFLSRFVSRFLPCALLFGLLTGCSEPEQPDTLLIDNIQGYSFNNQRELFNFSAMAIRDGKVLATGDSEIAANYPKAEKFDGQGKTLIPGIIDAHGHVSSLGFTLLSIDVRGLASAQQAAEKVANYAAEQPQLQWIKGRGWNQVLWPDQQFPSAALLDQFIDDRPVWLNRVDGHAGWANSAAMKAAGIDKNTPRRRWQPHGRVYRQRHGPYRPSSAQTNR
jgi:predicted amidohydrolase YtcJ